MYMYIIWRGLWDKTFPSPGVTGTDRDRRWRGQVLHPSGQTDIYSSFCPLPPGTGLWFGERDLPAFLCLSLLCCPSPSHSLSHFCLSLLPLSHLPCLPAFFPSLSLSLLFLSCTYTHSPSHLPLSLFSPPSLFYHFWCFKPEAKEEGQGLWH